MRNALRISAEAITIAVLFDLLILTTALAQIAVEGRTGYWNGFWRWQAEVIIGLLP